MTTEEELQHELQRFTSRFMDRIAQAGAPSTVDVPDHRRANELISERVLLYCSSALDIATGPYPELNIVDMLVFASLCSAALERHWIPSELGEQGRALADTFEVCKHELWELVDKILSSEQQANVRDLIQAWLVAHPEHYRVEGVRFHEFAAYASDLVAERKVRARGLLSQITAAAKTADQALLLGERAMFLVHRLPFLMRLQARVSARELLADSMQQVERIPEVIARLPPLQPLLQELSTVSANTNSAAREARLLSTAAEPYLAWLERLWARSDQPTAGAKGSAAVLQDLLQLADRTLLLTGELRGLVPSDPMSSLDTFSQHLDRTVRRWLTYLLLVGLCWATFFWVGSCTAAPLARAIKAALHT